MSTYTKITTKMTTIPKLILQQYHWPMSSQPVQLFHKLHHVKVFIVWSVYLRLWIVNGSLEVIYTDNWKVKSLLYMTLYRQKWSLSELQQPHECHLQDRTKNRAWCSHSDYMIRKHLMSCNHAAVHCIKPCSCRWGASSHECALDKSAERRGHDVSFMECTLGRTEPSKGIICLSQFVLCPNRAKFCGD